MQRWVLGALLLAGCDDELYGSVESVDAEEYLAYPANWDGMTLLFEDHCVACHGASIEDPPGGLHLPQGVEDDVLAGSSDYVVPGDPDASLLWHKLSGALTELEGAPMPLGSGPLPDDQIYPVRAWIEAGAPLGAP